MGMTIETYAADELRRVALPGKAVPTLFWALPVGVWSTKALTALWGEFTTGCSPCARFGLLLVTRRSRPRGEAHQAKWAESGAEARLSDLVPFVPANIRCAVGEVGADLADGDEPGSGLLVLSGAWPQPGWGVLLRGEGSEELLKSAVGALNAAVNLECLGSHRSTFKQAQVAFTKRTEHGQPPSVPRKPHEDIEDLRRLIGTLNGHQETSDDKPDELLLSLCHRLGVDTTIAKGAADHLRLLRENGGVEGVAALMGGQPADDGSSQGARYLLGELRRHLAGEEPSEGYEAWLISQRRGWLRDLEQASTALYEGLGRRVVDWSAGQHSVRTWSDKADSLDKELRRCLDAAFDAQWTAAPIFLEALEGAPPHALPITWDPARMVGWKLAMRRPDLTKRHVVEAANRLVSLEHRQVVGDGDLNGSVFADFTYYVAMTTNSLGAKEAAKKLLAEILPHGSADQLITDSGWWEPRQGFIYRACSTRASRVPTTPPSLATCNPASSWDPLRIRSAVEGLLTDIVQVCLSRLGWEQEEISGKIHHYVPQFQRSGPVSAELSKLTIGGATVLLHRMLPSAFPDRAEEALKFLALADRLRSTLNPYAHAGAPAQPSGDHATQLAQELRQLMESAERVVDELPWHLTPSQVSSLGPSVKIATGYAWNHRSVGEQLIRVALTPSEVTDAMILVWNPSGTNPVMMDARIVHRLPRLQRS